MAMGHCLRCRGCFSLYANPLLQTAAWLPCCCRGSDQVGQRAYIALSALPGPFGLEPGASFDEVWQALHPLVHAMGEQLALWASGQRQAYQASLLSTLHRDAGEAFFSATTAWQQCGASLALERRAHLCSRDS